MDTATVTLFLQLAVQAAAAFGPDIIRGLKSYFSGNEGNLSPEQRQQGLQKIAQVERIQKSQTPEQRKALLANHPAIQNQMKKEQREALKQREGYDKIYGEGAYDKAAGRVPEQPAVAGQAVASEVIPQATPGEGFEAINNMGNQATTAQAGGQRQGNFWEGYPGYSELYPLYNPRDLEIMDRLAQMGFSDLDPKKSEQYAINQFHKQIVPGIAGQFSGGAASSPSLIAQLGGAGSDLAERLSQARRSNAHKLLSHGLKEKYSNVIFPREKGLQENLANNVARRAPELFDKATDLVGKKLADVYNNYNKPADENAQEANQTPQPIVAKPTSQQMVQQAIQDQTTPYNNSVNDIANKYGQQPNILSGVQNMTPKVKPRVGGIASRSNGMVGRVGQQIYGQ